jgi:hypothetical protein
VIVSIFLWNPILYLLLLFCQLIQKFVTHFILVSVTARGNFIALTLVARAVIVPFSRNHFLFLFFFCQQKNLKLAVKQFYLQLQKRFIARA